MPLLRSGGGLPAARIRLSQTPTRFFSASTLRHGQLSVFVHNLRLSHNDLKQSTLNEVELYAERFKHHLHIGTDYSHRSVLFDQMVPPEQSDGVLVVASPEFVSWIDDTHFLPNLLRVLFHSSPSWGKPSPDVVNVVSAVAAGIATHSPGISILHGKTSTILPECNRHHLLTPHELGDKNASLSFTLSPLSPTFGKQGSAAATLEATVPLANTIFDNGLPSTLRASIWTRNKAGSYEMIEELPLSRQHVVPETTMKASRTCGTVPLMAVCPPRKVVSGLGNIVRQIEIDGAVVPASKELEKNVDMLVTSSPNPSPVNIWAVMIPEAKLLSANNPFGAMFQEERLVSFNKHIQSQDIPPISTNTLVHGCQIFQVLSGGGGWGAKQGLLSLDSETRYTNAGEDADLEAFIQSFTSFRDSGASIGAVTPGHYVQFFINFPHPTTPLVPGTFFGTCSDDVYNPTTAEKEQAVSMLIGHFGTLSSQGLFLCDSQSKPPIEAKISTSGACLQGTWPIPE